MDFIYKNGQFISREQAQVSAWDRGFLYGDGVFTTLKVFDGCIELWKPHLKRLERDARALSIKFVPINEEAALELLHLNQAEKGAYRLKIILSGGETHGFSLHPREGVVLMTLAHYLPDEREEHHLIQYPEPVIHPLARHKTLAYLERFWLAEYARQHQAQEVLTINQEGVLMEGAFSNLFWRIRQRLYFPDPTLPFLEGITVNMAKNGALSLGMTLHPVKATEIPLEANCFYCSSMKGIQPVTSIGDKNYARDPSWEAAFKTVVEIAKRELSLSV